VRRMIQPIASMMKTGATALTSGVNEDTSAVD
jgi:hypothetical protein